MAGVELVSTEFSGPLPSPVFDERYIFGVCEEGEADLATYRGEFRLRAGSMMFRSPGELCAVRRRHSESTRNRALNIDAASLGRYVEPGQLHRLAGFHVGDEASAADLRAVFDAAARGEEPLAVEVALARFFAGIAERLGPVAPPRSDRPAVRLARDFLAARVDGNVTLDDLERVAGLTRFHLVRVFHREVGVTPHEFQLQMRIDKARALIRHGTALVDAARETGFADQSHLTRHFKRIVGVPPGVYRRAWMP